MAFRETTMFWRSQGELHERITGYGHKMLKILFLMNHVFFKVAYLAIPSHSGEKMKFLNTIPLESV